MKLNYSILHYSSVSFTSILIFSILFTIQNLAFTILFNKFTIVIFDAFYLHQLIFIVTSILFMKRFLKINSSYK